MIIKVIIQLKTVKSGPILISNVHKSNNKGLNGLFGSKHSTLTYLERFLVSSWYQDKKNPDKSPPDINPRTKTPWTKTPRTKTPQRKLINTKYILHK